MKNVRPTGRYLKDLKRAQLRGWDLEKLETTLDLLRAGKPLPASNRDHALKGRWQYYRECHIAPDWLLIYRDRGDALELVRTSTHADLFG
jgi:mRNA interferase YafQ